MQVPNFFLVPLLQDRNIGMNWTYTLERMPSPKHRNMHVVRVTSKSRRGVGVGGGGGDGRRALEDKIDIHFFTNVDEHAIKVRPTNGRVGWDNRKLLKERAKVTPTLLCGYVVASLNTCNT